MRRTPHLEDERAELAERAAGGVRVRLLWARRTDTLVVSVRDDGLDDAFELVLEPNADPLDVYAHPYAYAAWRGVDVRTREPQAA